MKKPKKKRRLPKDIAERPDREVMEKLFGKNVMKAVEKMTGHDEEVSTREDNDLAASI